MPNNPFPKQSNSQAVGAEACRVFGARQPESWNEESVDGDNDFGFDYVIQLSVSGEIRHLFFAQLKGTTRPRYIENGRYISYSFKASTLNLYQNVQDAVMVVLVDLTSGSNRADRLVYYKWLDQDFFESVKNKIGSQDEITIRISTENKITPELDIEQYLQTRLNEHLECRSILNELSKCGTDPLQAILSIRKTLSSSSAAIPSNERVALTEYPWQIGCISECSRKLKEAFELIRLNKFADIENIHTELGRQVDDLTRHEHAEWLSQRAIVAFRNSNYHHGLECARQASNLTEIRRYTLAYYELLFFEVDLSTPDELERVLNDLDTTKPEELLIAVKCLATLNRDSEISELLSKQGSLPALCELHICSILGDRELFIRAKNRINVNHLREPSDKLLYYVLVGQKQYHETIEGIETTGEQPPIHGRENYNKGALSHCFDNIKNAWEVAERLGYPISIQLIMHESVHVFSIFENSPELIRHIEKMSVERAPNIEVTHCLAVLLSNQAQFGRAICAIERLNSCITPELSSILVYAHYRNGKYSRVLELFDELRREILQCTNDTINRTIGIALQCAVAQLDFDKEEDLKNLLKSIEGGEITLAVSEYFNKVNLNAKEKDELDRDLYATFLDLDKPLEIAEQLFGTINPSRQNAEIIVDLGETILEIKRLHSSGYVHYVEALIHLGHWDKVIVICDDFLTIDPTSVQWNLVKSAYLEYKGKLTEALEVIDELVDEDRAVLHNAAELGFRLGKVDYTETKLLELLNLEKDRKRKIRVIELLLFIYSSDEKYKIKLDKVFDKYGRLVDQEDEIEEGKYLIRRMLLVDSDDDERSDFRCRLSRYVAAFPNSPIFVSISTHAEADGQGILDEMSGFTGVNNDLLHEWESNRQRISDGKLVVPFCHLSEVLPDTSDIYTSWILSKNLGPDRLEYKFRHSAINTIITPSEFISGTKVFIDLLSMIILAELGVLRSLISVLGQVYIDRIDYQNIQQASHPRMGSPCWSIAKLVYDNLRDKIDKITLVSSEKRLAYSRYQDHLSSNKYIFICDDQHMILCVNRLDEHLYSSAINSVNVLKILKDLRHINSADYYKKIGEFCSLGVVAPSLLHVDIAEMLLSFGETSDSAALDDTVFRNVFERVFEAGETDAENALRNLASISKCAYINSTARPKISDIKTILDSFSLRISSLHTNNLYADWFVMTAISIEPQFPHLPIKQSPIHKVLWEVYETISREQFDQDMSFAKLVEPIVIRLSKLESAMAGDALIILKSAFVPGTPDYDQFDSLYQRAVLGEKMKN